MPYYNEEFKEQIIRKMMAPNAQSVAEVSRESGVSEQSLYNWRNKYRQEENAVPSDPSDPSNPDKWSGANKLAVVIETASLNEEQRSEYCRKKGLYPEQIERWKEGAIAGNELPGKSTTTRRAGGMMKAPGRGYCQTPANCICSWRFSSRSWFLM